MLTGSLPPAATASRDIVPCAATGKPRPISLLTGDSVPSTTMRRTRFCSSRTLPGHAYSMKSCMVSGDTSAYGLPYSSEYRRRKYSVSIGMSSRRSRSGGRSIDTTFSRK